MSSHCRLDSVLLKTKMKLLTYLYVKIKIILGLRTRTERKHKKICIFLKKLEIEEDKKLGNLSSSITHGAKTETEHKLYFGFGTQPKFLFSSEFFNPLKNCFSNKC